MVVPVIIVTINYIAFSVGLVHVPMIIQPFTVPVGLSGFIASGGDLRGSLLQFFDLAVSAVLYYPFFKAWERILVAKEEAQEEKNRLATQTVQRVQRQETAKAVGMRKEGP
jgi:cellobiose PTS system EIIC component